MSALEPLLFAGSPAADRRIGYLTKYLTKSIADTYGDDDEITPAQAAHLDRLYEEVWWLPCSPRCWNWLRYGVQPQHAADGMEPGRCPAKAHDREHLGCGGRRVLVSRKWSGKTLGEHKADRAAVVRETLLAAGMDMHEVDRLSATTTPYGTPRFRWSTWDPVDSSVPVYRQVMIRAIGERMRWKAQYDQAKQRAGPSSDANSATDSPTGSEARPPTRGEVA